VTGTDPLRTELRELADVVVPADLYERSLIRSRGIGRREAAIGTAAAVFALALLGSGLWRLPKGHESKPPVAVAPIDSSASVPMAPTATAPTRPAEGAFGGPSRPDRPRPHSSPSKPRSTALGDVPGQIFYDDEDDGRLVRLTGAGNPKTVLSATNSAAGVSPDGSRIAYVTDGTLMVVDTGGDDPRQAYVGTASAEQAPAWSPDSTRLLIDAADPGVLDVATGRLAPLAEGLEGRHFRWSGDGTTLVYATPDCGLEVAGTTARSGTPVPDQSGTDGRAACRPVSVDATGALVAVQLEPSAGVDPAEAPADAVLDTVTGDIVDLPVSGKIIGAVFDPDGNLLVRSKKDGKTRLWLFDRNFTLLVQAKEPKALKGLDLLAYTR
jgi:TolB protein